MKAWRMTWLIGFLPILAGFGCRTLPPGYGTVGAYLVKKVQTRSGSVILVQEYSTVDSSAKRA